MSLSEQVDKALDSLILSGTTDYIGEEISQLEHALQGAYFAMQSGHSPEVILATLFHDIGHFASNTRQNNMAHLGIVYHEWIGAKLAYDFGFSAKVALLIGYHVDAKRYLAGKKKDYFNRLSKASKGTLEFQGGPMSEEEQNSFEAHPLFREILQVRVNDEKAKIVDLEVPNLDFYRDLIAEHVQRNQNRMKECSLMDYVDTPWVLSFKDRLEISALAELQG